MHERYIIQTYMDEIYKHAFRMCAMWEAQAFSLMNYCGFDIEPFCSGVCGDYRCPQTLAEICRIMGIYCDFRAVADRGKYPGFMLLAFACIFTQRRKIIWNVLVIYLVSYFQIKEIPKSELFSVGYTVRRNMALLNEIFLSSLLN